MTAEPVTVIIAGPAVAKGRPRMTRRGFVYTPAATRKYEAHGRLAAQSAMNGRPPIAVPVRLVALIELPVPASWSGRKRVAAITGDIRPTTGQTWTTTPRRRPTRLMASSSPTTA